MTTYPTGIDAAMLQGIDAVLGVRDAVGAVIRPVFFVTRTWYKNPELTIPAARPEGYAKDDVPVQLLPSPGMKDFSQDLRTREGGAVKAGDIILKQISKAKFTRADLEQFKIPNKQRIYQVGDKLYEVINVTEKHVTFDVQVRELSNQKRYLNHG